ncbi:MAG TPA: glucose-6-phosphate dehydrogenase assembly protein OpcA [Miltoncostaeaceae bacterium]|nr:glucose-6-phosphate dehydrogenase assembly protein OpcA [Miltoncostaeaceae bacterium]
MSAVATLPRAEWRAAGVTVDEVARQLQRQRRPADGGAPFMLSGVMNLVAYAGHPSETAAMLSVIERLADHQPSRAVVLCGEPDGSGIDARVITGCRSVGGATRIALETVVVILHGDVSAGAASATVPLLRSDLPTTLWWPWAPDARADPALAPLVAIADRVVTEAARGTDARGAVRALAAWVPAARPAVTDLSWAAVTGWRQLIVQMLEGDALDALRAGPATVRIFHGAGDLPDALLLGGWLRDLIGPGLQAEVTERDDGDGFGVAAVTLEGAHGRRMVIERATGRDAASVLVSEPDGTERHRVLPLPRPDRTRLLAGELELQRRDRAFERALAGACAAGLA